MGAVADDDKVAIRHPDTGGLTTITERQWREGRYRERGWEQADMADYEVLQAASTVAHRRVTSLDQLTAAEAAKLADRLGASLPGRATKETATKAVEKVAKAAAKTGQPLGAGATPDEAAASDAAADSNATSTSGQAAGNQGG